MNATAEHVDRAFRSPDDVAADATRRSRRSALRYVSVDERRRGGAVGHRVEERAERASSFQWRAAQLQRSVNAAAPKRRPSGRR